MKNLNKYGTISKKKNKYYSFDIHFDFHYPGFLNGHLKLFVEDFIISAKLFLMNIFNLYIIWNKHSDHAGFMIMLSILGLVVTFNIYDSRHWDYEKSEWCDEYDDV